MEPRLLMSAALAEPLENLYVTSTINESTVDLDHHFNDATIDGTVVEFNSTLGTFYAEMFDVATDGHTAAPLTVANFLRYINANRYVDSLVHRLDDDFVMQGGGFTEPAAEPFGVQAVPTFAAVQNEFSATRSNLRGTLAMAKQGGNPDSATSQWFVNLADNSANLDNQNGGFTAFAQVLGDGMDVVDAIEAVPTFDKSGNGADDLNNGALNEIPLRDYTDGNPVTRDNLILFSTIEQVSELVYSVLTNSNTGLVDATTDEHGHLHLEWVPGMVGSAQIVIRASDRFDPLNFVEDTMTVTRFNGQRGQTLVDDNGNNVKIRLAGDGEMEISQEDGGAIESLTLTDTNRLSRLTISAAKNAETEVGDIFVTGDLESLLAKGVNLGGDLRVTGVLGELVLGDVADDHTIAVTGTGRVVADITYVTLGRVAESTITIATPVVDFKCIDWQDDNAEADSLTAPWIGSLMVTGDKKNDIAGDFEAGLTLNGSQLDANLVPVLLDNAKISGVLRNAAWSIQRGVGNVSFGGGVIDSTFRATGSINSFTAARLENATVFASVVGGVTTLPDAAVDFIGGGGDTPLPVTLLAKINKLSIPGLKDSEDDAFVSSLVAAGQIGNAKVGKVATDNDATEHGFSTRALGTLAYTDAEGVKQSLKQEDIEGGLFEDEDFIVRVV